VTVDEHLYWGLVYYNWVKDEVGSLSQLDILGSCRGTAALLVKRARISRRAAYLS